MTTTLAPFATQLQDEVEYGEKGMFRKYLVKDEKRQAMLICLQAGIQIPEHTSSYSGFITVIQGRGVFQLAGREVALEPGVFIELPANTLHALSAIDNLAMLKVVDRHDASDSPPERTEASCSEPGSMKQPKPGTCAESLAEMLKPFLPQVP